MKAVDFANQILDMVKKSDNEDMEIYMCQDGYDCTFNPSLEVLGCIDVDNEGKEVNAIIISWDE